MNKKKSTPSPKSKEKGKNARSRPNRDPYATVGNALANACLVLLAIGALCFVLGHDGCGWPLLGLAIVPVVLFLAFHAAIVVLFKKTMKEVSPAPVNTNDQ